MSGPSISYENLQNAIDLFAGDIKASFTKFEELEDIIISLKSDYKHQNTINDIKCEFLNKCEELVKSQLKEDNIGKIKKEISVLAKLRDELKNLFMEIDDLDSNVKSKIKNYIINKDNEVTDFQENVHMSPNKVNLFVLQSRQTEEPFVMMTMKGGSRYKCSGCNLNIPIQSRFLSHIEEFPSGSKTFIPHSYHINSECLLQRGFEVSYLEKAKVNSSESINKDIIDILHEIGFKKKNMKMKDSIISDSDKESENNDDFPDNVSDTSNISSNRGEGPSDAHSASFTYHRKPQDQKRNIICHGCKSNIDEEAYLTYDDKIQSLPVHIKKRCIKEGIFHSDFSRTICKVYKLLRTHDELKELIACGFYFNKIIGFRPSNPNVKRPFSKPLQKPGKPRENQGDNSTNCLFIFNDEPFILERLPHGERCRGCNNQIKRDELSLRHKERVPRERMDQSPLISQYYHADRSCLFDRGFNLKYLSFIKCDAILAGDDNLAKFTEVLSKCGFSNEKIIYQTKNSQDIRGFETTSSLPNKPDKEYKLFIINCVNSSSHCEGCGFIVIPNQPCFIYSLTAFQNGNAKIFHIKNTCLKAHFAKEQLLAMTCVNNNVVDVSPNEVINCGIVKIVTDNQFSAPFPKRPNVRNFKPKLKNQKPLSFIVDIVVDDRYPCAVCKGRLILDKYVIKMIGKDPEHSHVHLDHHCVKKLGYSDSELARSRLKLNVFLSPDGITRLRYCGFRDVPSK